MRRREYLFLFPWLMVVALAPGCASHKAYVLARRDASFSPTPATRIAMVDHLKPRPEDQELSVALMAELKRQGFHLVPQGEAEYTLSYWIEENWRQRKVLVKTYDPVGLDPGFNSSAIPRSQLEYGMAVSGGTIYPSPRDGRVTETWVDDPVAVQGIRLQLYSRESARAGRLQTAWEGYIDAGFKVSPEREPILLRTLLTYFGKDYAGRARLVE
jgi:hypothetical protein